MSGLTTRSASANANNTNNNNNNTTAATNETLTRTLLVQIEGNRTQWESMGQSYGAVWRVTPEQASAIFLSNDKGDNTERLSRAMIRRVTLLESHTNIDEPVAIHIEGIPPREFTCLGEGASVFLTGEGHNLQPQELFSVTGNADTGLQWMRMFPRYTSENLETEGVMFLTGASYYFVHQEHPTIHFLRANEVELGLHLAQEPTLDGCWIRVDTDTFMYSVRSLRETVLRNAPTTFDLSTISVRLAKPDNQTWGTVTHQNLDRLMHEDRDNHNKNNRNNNMANKLNSGNGKKSNVVVTAAATTSTTTTVQSDSDEDENNDDDDDDLQTFAKSRSKVLQRYFERPLFARLRLAFEYALPELTTTTTTTITATTITAVAAPPPSLQGVGLPSSSGGKRT